MAIMDLFKRTDDYPKARDLSEVVRGWSIEVMPRTASKIESFRAILPAGTLVYIAHIDGTPIEEMVATAKRLNAEGFPVMPHFPARIIADKAVLADWIARYQGEANVERALLLGGGVAQPAGDFQSSIQLIETGLFDKAKFTQLHVAGHPEGNKDIDKDGSTKNIDESLMWKVDFSARTDATMAIATQFAFDAAGIGAWAERIQRMGCTLPIHVGIAGPAKLQTLIKYAIACGVGPSVKVLQKRALDVTKLLLSYEPTDVVSGLANYVAEKPDSLIRKLHVFPLGGIKSGAEWMVARGMAEPVDA